MVVCLIDIILVKVGKVVYLKALYKKHELK